MPELIRYATLAASGHSTQPWQFAVRPNAIEIHPEVTLFGRRFSTMACTNDCEELRTKITPLAVAGERAVLLDSPDGKVGNAVFDNALTSAFW